MVAKVASMRSTRMVKARSQLIGSKGWSMRARQGRGEAVGVQGFAHGGALDAHLAQGRGMVAVATGGPEAAGFSGSLQLQAAAHTAVGALS